MPGAGAVRQAADQFPRVADKLAMMAVEIMIARQLTYFSAREKDEGRRCDLEAGMAKLLGARVAWACADNALQIHGGNGFALEYPISRVLCDARILNIFEGAAEIQAQVIARNEGRIVQCSSVLGLLAAPYRGAYCASKFAIEALTDTLRIELKGTGIHVSLIEPGPIRTRFIETAIKHYKQNIDMENSAHAEIYRERLAKMEDGGQMAFKLEPEAVCRRLVHALEAKRPKTRYYVTVPTFVGAYLRRILPARALDFVAAKN
jgi:NAD(P)-dependent dehydrogenase (short-subunit alcohol dehydrogenase family)